MTGFKLKSSSTHVVTFSSFEPDLFSAIHQFFRVIFSIKYCWFLLLPFFNFLLLYEALARNKMLLGIWYLLYMELKVIEEALPFGMDKNESWAAGFTEKVLLNFFEIGLKYLHGVMKHLAYLRMKFFEMHLRTKFRFCPTKIPKGNRI